MFSFMSDKFVYKTNKMADNPSVDNSDRFKPVYKFYRRRDRPCNVDGVIDFSSSGATHSNKAVEFKLQQPKSLPSFPGLKPITEWRAFVLKACPGFIVIQNPFKAKYQRYWIKRCLLDFSTKPNTTNLDAHMKRPAQIWLNCVHERNEPDLTKDSLLMKLRWATLGYQYEWNTKEYFSNRVQAFPDDLKHICSYIAAALGYENYSSEAGIVNYYRMDSTLMGHTDVSELDKAAPLISFSFGQSCIFLIGGPTKETEPIPLFLHSGDICLMTGEARLSYHAVPRIYPSEKQYFHACFHDNNHGKELQSVISEKERDSEENQQYDSIVSDEVSERNVTDKTFVNVESSHSGIDNDMDTEEDPYSKSEKRRIYLENMDKLADDCGDPIHVTETVNGNKCTVDELSALMDVVVENTDWQPFENYVAQSRINVNVRQVLKPGLTLKPKAQIM